MNGDMNMMQGMYGYNTELEKSCLLLCLFWFRHKSISDIHNYFIISRSGLVAWQWMILWIFSNF